uniref:cell death-inducing p53-target protein 1 isoform X2 n=1 Tax=Euleptes europaea TaxID=460621 RepID=UPI002540046C|nr:cell death-inducing p53-target protein 1 isoform X2 [Euleptes europaea]
MSSDPPPPYPGGPSAPLLEQKDGSRPFLCPPPSLGGVSPSMVQPQGPPQPPSEYGPPPYEPPLQPGFIPMPADGSVPYMPPGAATTVTVLQGEIFQAAPVPTVCPHCQQAITTKISHEIGFMSFLVGFFCCFVGCDLGCCLIPCLLDDFKDVTHTCPNCKGYIYTYKRMC